MKKSIRKKYRKLPATQKSVIARSIRFFHKIGFAIRRPFKNAASGIYPPEVLKEYNLQRPFGPRPLICYAPSVSMFFSVFGKAAPCYATYPRLNATWGEKTIGELWAGREFHEVRRQVKANDLSGHCRFCHIPLMNKNYGSLLARKYDHYQFYDKQYPAIMEFELENTCNLQCVMCNGFLSSSIRQQREKNPPLPKAYNERFVKELEEFIPHLKVAEFTGGDPFLIGIYYDIWEKISAINPDCNILITTNANTYNDRIAKLLHETKNISFNVSIDSMQKEVYEKIRVGGIFENAMRNISVFHDYCTKNKTTLNFLVCPLRMNWREFPDFIKYGNGHGISIFFHMVIKPEKLALWSLPSSELKEISDYLSTFEYPASNPLEKQNKENYFHLVSLVKTWHQKAIERENSEGYKYTLADTSEKEQLFIESVKTYVMNNMSGGDIQTRCHALELKIKQVFGLLPRDFDKDVFLNHLLTIAVDDYIITSLENTDEKTLAELIVNWVFYE